MRMLLFTVLLAALASGWAARHLQEARNCVALVAELDRVQVYVWQYEPTPLGRCVRELPSPVEKWIRTRLGDSLLSGPCAISAYHMREDQIPYLLDRLRQFRTLRTVNFGSGHLTEESFDRIRQALPNVEVDVNPSVGVFAGN
jgi:hypothetical protein